MEDPTGFGIFSLNRKEGSKTGQYSSAEGQDTTASGEASHAEGYDTVASDVCSHAEGNQTTASGRNSHAEGYCTVASGMSAHAEGDGNSAIGDYSHAEGFNVEASGESSHAEGYNTAASDEACHAEGVDTVADDTACHAEGYGSKATVRYSHAEGWNTEAKGEASHVEGLGTIASKNAQHVQGKYNVEDTEGIYTHIVGGGTSSTDRKNIHTLDLLGNAVFAGDVTNGNGVSMDGLMSLLGTTGQLRTIVTELPTENISTETIYMMPKESGGDNDIYNEYINVDGTVEGWEFIGTSAVDLSNYYTKLQVDELISPEYEEVEELEELISGEKITVALGKLAKAVKEFISHKADKLVHITAEERKAWNTQADTIKNLTTIKNVSVQTNINFNDITIPGLFQYAIQCTTEERNAPELNTVFYIYNICRDSSNMEQFAFAENKNKLFYRIRNDTKWGAWVQIITSEHISKNFTTEDWSQIAAAPLVKQLYEKNQDLESKITKIQNQLSTRFDVPAKSSITLHMPNQHNLVLFYTHMVIPAYKSITFASAGNGNNTNAGQRASLFRIVESQYVTYEVSDVKGYYNDVTITNSGDYTIYVMCTSFGGTLPTLVN